MTEASTHSSQLSEQRHAISCGEPGIRLGETYILRRRRKVADREAGGQLSWRVFLFPSLIFKKRNQLRETCMRAKLVRPVSGTGRGLRKYRYFAS